MDHAPTVSFSKHDVVGADIAADMVAQFQAKNNFMANIQVFKTQDAMAGTLLSLRA